MDLNRREAPVLVRFLEVVGEGFHSERPFQTRGVNVSLDLDSL